MSVFPLHLISPNPNQPREDFDQDALANLAASIQERGMLQPILIEPDGDTGRYIIIAGERRYRAHQLLGLETIEAIVRPNNDSKGRLTDALVENIQRADMNIVEKGKAYTLLRDDHGMSSRQISRIVGESENHVVLAIKVYSLEPEVRAEMANGNIPHNVKVVDALIKLPPEVRIPLSLELGKHKLRVNTCLKAIEKAGEHVIEKPIKGIPALTLAAAKIDTTQPRTAWDVFELAGRLPPWGALVKSARNTCDACALRSQASAQNCDSCTLVEFLRRIMQEAHV